MLILIFYLIAGLILLFLGGNFLVKGASNLAMIMKISSLIIGLTIVAYGTGFPELAVTSIAVLKNEASFSLGNVIGSNILNILFVLGLCALIFPLKIHKQLIKIDVPIMIAVSLFFYLLTLKGSLTRIDGLLLLFLFLLYLLLVLYLSRKEKLKTSLPVHKGFSIGRTLFFCGIGLVFLILGADLFIRGAEKIALLFSLNEFVVGLTIVAIGTSLPEIATCLAAIFRKEPDIAVGNIIGSNIFNLLAAMGFAALISPHPIPVSQNALYFDQPILCITAIACLPIFFTGHQIFRWEGFLFLTYYAFYLYYLYSISHPTFFHKLFLDSFVFFITPLTLVTLAISFYRHWKPKK